MKMALFLGVDMSETPGSLTPGQDAFLNAPLYEVAKVAPEAIVFAAAGTRRSAALAGLASSSDEFASLSRMQMIDACQLIFDHGVRHIFTVLATPGQFREVGEYRAKLHDWITRGVSGPEALADYRRLGWRVRLLCDDDFPGVYAMQADLHEVMPAAAEKTLWLLVVPDAEAPWRWLLAAVLREQARTRAEAIHALYGEAVPLITLFLAFGKPIISPDLLPPLLAGTVHCYWTQRPGYQLTVKELRLVLYDYAFLRKTWSEDKTGRAEEVLATRAAWEQGPILGLGMRLGPFWYPQPLGRS